MTDEQVDRIAVALNQIAEATLDQAEASRDHTKSVDRLYESYVLRDKRDASFLEQRLKESKVVTERQEWLLEYEKARATVVAETEAHSKEVVMLQKRDLELIVEQRERSKKVDELFEEERKERKERGKTK